MAGVLDAVNQRTQLVGQNRLELLLFRLDGSQLYGINVFKVKEVLQCPKLTVMPKSSPVVRGVASIRGGTFPIIDLAMATGRRGLEDINNCFVIITEYNTKVQGFLVRSVERIVNMNWEGINPPPKGTGRDHYLTAVTRVDNQLVEIIDVEKILSEVAPSVETVSAGVISEVVQAKGRHQARSDRRRLLGGPQASEPLPGNRRGRGHLPQRRSPGPELSPGDGGGRQASGRGIADDHFRHRDAGNGWLHPDGGNPS